MMCRRCKSSYEGERHKTCPHCGEPRPRPRPRFLKTSAILIAEGSARRFYRTMDEVPAPLRSKLLKSTNGANSATILIADRKGREEIAKAVRRMPARSARAVPAVLRSSSKLLRRSAGALLALLSALTLWAVLGWPWS